MLRAGFPQSMIAQTLPSDFGGRPRRPGRAAGALRGAFAARGGRGGGDLHAEHRGERLQLDGELAEQLEVVALGLEAVHQLLKRLQLDGNLGANHLAEGLVDGHMCLNSRKRQTSGPLLTGSRANV